MDNIGKFLKSNSKFSKLSGPLRAAQICDEARALADSRFTVISFCDGLLTLGVESSMAAANLQFESPKIIEKINQKIGDNLVQKIRFKNNI